VNDRDDEATVVLAEVIGAMSPDAAMSAFERPGLFAAPAIIERRLSRFAARLGLDADRALSWAFAQAVLSAIWDIEDGSDGHGTPPSLRLAEAIRSMLM